jgi:hypothetical protein
MWPDIDSVCVSVDSAFTEKEENDPTGCTTWGLWTDLTDGFPKIMLIMAWRKHLPARRAAGDRESEAERQPRWLVQIPTSHCVAQIQQKATAARSEAAGAFDGQALRRENAPRASVGVPGAQL